MICKLLTGIAIAFAIILAVLFLSPFFLFGELAMAAQKFAAQTRRGIVDAYPDQRVS